MTATRLLPALLGALLMLGSAPAAAQSVRGDLRDADRDRPLPGARLLLLDRDGVAVDSTLTDRAAAFRLQARDAGTYTVYFRIDGYATVMSEPVELRAGDVARLDFRVPLVASAAIRQMSDMVQMEARLQESLPEICDEPFRAWEAGLLLGTVRRRAGNAPVPGAQVEVLDSAGVVARTTVASENGVYVLCNLPVGPAIRITVRAPDGTVENTDVEIRPGSASWYDLPIGPRRR
jgi:hypothetical protein